MNKSLPIPGTEYTLPLTVLQGSTPGPTVLLTAGIHNAEYVGIQAAMELAQELASAGRAGALILVPLVNVSGFSHRTMSLCFEDGKNLNREFPGNEDGTVAEKICAVITKELFSKADAYIDLHSGDGYEALTPYVYYVGPVEKEVKETALSMARCVDVPFIVESQCTTGGAYNVANALGLPAILLERGCMGAWSRAEVEADKADVRRILAMLGVLKRQACADFEAVFAKEREVFTEVIYEDAPIHGCWYPHKPPGEKVQAGEPLGEIRDYFGNLLHTCIAKKDGILLYQTASLSILKEGPMVAYGVLS